MMMWRPQILNFFIHFVATILVSQVASAAPHLEYVADFTIPSGTKFKKTTIGGLSGIYYSEEKKRLIAVSDDRGNVNEPRIYEFDFSVKNSGAGVEMQITPQAVHFLRPAKSNHEEIPTGVWPRGKVLDLEGIAPSPWGDYLITSEGDNNKRPRQPPQVLNFKTNGAYVTEFSIPEEFLPEPSGLQKKGVRNNRSFEAISASPSLKRILVGMESSLVQDPLSCSRWVEYEMAAPFVLKPIKQYFYPLTKDSADKSFSDLDPGLSDFIFVDETQVLAMERSVELTLPGPQFGVEIFLVSVPGTTSDKAELKKTSLLNLKSLISRFKTIKNVENFEGMAWVPLASGKANDGAKEKLKSSEKALLLVSDNNFSKHHPTHFLLLKLVDDLKK